MKNTLRMAMVVLILVGLSHGTLWAKETEFEFYFQKIDKVEEINNPAPKGWWEKTKSFLTGVKNTVAGFVEKNITRSYLPGEGTKRWYSEENPNIAYQVSRVKVRDEAHLLELLGAKNGDLSKLSNGQRALLAVYKHSKSQAIKDRLKYSSRSSVKVMLTDTSGFEDASKYPNLEKDFWPCSTGAAIFMNSAHYNYYGGEDDSRSTFVHEVSHSLDNTFKEFIHPYGKDDSHFSNEKTGKRAAFLEGFAEFNQMLDSQMKAASIKANIQQIVVESATKAGDYKTYASNGPELSGIDLTNVEGINAMILYRMATEITGGRDKVFASFKSTNYPWRSLKNVLGDFVKKNPDQAAKVASILNDETYGKLSDVQMRDFLGSSEVVNQFLAKGRKAAVAVISANDAHAPAGPTTKAKVTAPKSSTPFQ